MAQYENTDRRAEDIVDQLYNSAGDIANLVPCVLSDKEKIRRQILQLIKFGIETQQKNPIALERLNELLMR